MKINDEAIKTYVTREMLPEAGRGDLYFPHGIANNLQFAAQEPRLISTMSVWRKTEYISDSYNRIALCNSEPWISRGIHNLTVTLTGWFSSTRWEARYSVGGLEMIRFRHEYGEALDGDVASDYGKDTYKASFTRMIVFEKEDPGWQKLTLEVRLPAYISDAENIVPTHLVCCTYDTPMTPSI